MGADVTVGLFVIIRSAYALKNLRGFEAQRQNKIKPLFYIALPGLFYRYPDVSFYGYNNQ